MTTIEDVARHAGVSVATVSRVVNNSHTVSSEKSARVLAAIEELDYRPNISSQNLRRSETKTLLIICSVAMDEVLDGVYDAASELGYRVVVNYIGRTREKSISYFDELFLGNVDGALLYSAFYNDASLVKIAKSTPVVQCSSYLDIPNAFRVSIDEEKAGYDVTRHLLEQGKRRIGLITLDLPGITDAFFIKRERGYRRALADFGIQFDSALVKKCASGFESGFELGKQFIEMENKADAVFSVQDIMAYGVIQAAHDAGMPVPGGIAVAGFDNAEISELSRPRLTTVSQPFYELGNVATKLLVSLIKGEITVGRDIYLHHELIVRESTAVVTK